MKMIVALTIATAVALSTMAAAIALGNYTVINVLDTSASVPTFEATPKGHILLAGGDEVGNG